MGEGSGTATGSWVLATAIGAEAARSSWALAARERLQCHRYFGADVPEGGGVPAMPVITPVRLRSSG